MIPSKEDWDLRYGIRFSNEVWGMLVRVAKEEQMTLPAVIREAVDAYLSGGARRGRSFDLRAAIGIPKVDSRSKYSPDFERFWDGVPTKVGKGAAWKAWKLALKDADAEVIIAGLPGYVSYEVRRRATCKSDYRPLHPSTWLNGCRWEDEVEVFGGGAKTDWDAVSSEEGGAF